jgi:transposase
MSDLYWLSDEQMKRLRPFFPRAMASRALATCGC